MWINSKTINFEDYKPNGGWKYCEELLLLYSFELSTIRDANIKNYKIKSLKTSDQTNW